MPSAIAVLPWYFWSKAAVFALLACNAVFFFFIGAFTKALDASAWLVLLVLFEWETGHGERFRAKRAATVIHGTRLAAAAGVVTAAVGYGYEGEWLDAVNSWLWIAVVVLLEFEVRYPGAVEQHRSWFAAAAATLYAALAALVPVWAWRGEWFDAYDALLWLIAFVAIEINVLQISHREGSTDGNTKLADRS